MEGLEDQEACGIEQLYSGLEAGIDGGIHAMWLLWHHFALFDYLDEILDRLLHVMWGREIIVVSHPVCGGDTGVY